jgi:alpha-L-rhamnosidase
MTVNHFCRSLRSRRLLSILLLALLALTSAPATLPVRAEVGPPALLGQPIWVAGTEPPGSVGLFRYRMSLSQAATQVQLAIFADTRYEAWLDGVWLGRGPARFSRVRQEYDLLPAPDLAPGSHVLAVLVQYAPNTRRSESLRPLLQASLHGQVGGAPALLGASGPSWRAVSATAWNPSARPVSDLGLIGPTELLDLRQLPAGWTQPSFLDELSWPAAQPIVPAPFDDFSPRSIPLLRLTPRAPREVLEAGLLSPGMQLLDFDGSAGGSTRSVTLRASGRTTLRIEALDTATLLLDERPLTGWQELGDPRRPDLLVLTRTLTAGSFRLQISVPDKGRALLVGGPGISLSGAPPLQQGNDAGRRTLLLDPRPDLAGPQVRLGLGGAQVTVPAGTAPRYLTLDMGRTVFGRVEALVEGPAGTIVDIGWDERLREGRPLPAPGSLHAGLWRMVDSWVLDGSPRTISTIDARGGRYLLLHVYGPGAVTLRNLRVVEEGYPVEAIGRFSSSDARLNKIWQIGVDSAAVNMSDAYADPWRERGQWVGDMAVIYQINKVAFGDHALLRRALRQTADAMGADGRPAAYAPYSEAPPLLLDYGMHWVELLHDYWRSTGDLALVAELYPAARRLDGFLSGYENADGLISFAADARWYESALLDWSAGPARRGTSTGVNAQYAATLDLLAQMADALGTPDGEALRLRRDRVRTAINRELYDPARGYVSTLIDGVAARDVPVALAWTLAYGAVPTERERGALEALVRQLAPSEQPAQPNIEIFGAFWALDALGAGGRTLDALALIRSRYGPLLERGATTWWEGFTSDATHSASLSHGWGGAPTWFLSSYVLGARVLSPTTWQVAPQPGDLSWASGVLPTAAGPLEVGWQRPACGRFSLRIEAPAGSSGGATLPFTRPDLQVLLDGQLVWDGGPVEGAPAALTGEGIAITGLDAGVHQIDVAATCTSRYLPTMLR